MAFDNSMSCPSCGVAVEGINAHTRSMQCPHCGNWIYFSDGSWAATAGFEHALDAPGIFRVGRSGTLNGRRFVVAGRIRLGYGDNGVSGNWDEWWLEFADGEHQWLEEDDGSYQMHSLVAQRASAEQLHRCCVGAMVEIDGENYLVTEKNTADVAGAQGSVPIAVAPGERVECIEVVGGGHEYSIEISVDEVSMTESRPIIGASFDWD